MSSSLLSPLADGLIPAAMRSRATRGRRWPGAEHAFRNPFQRDRDRVIHASAFRRLEYKTQVFINGEGDHYRTRLTHTLEVTQIARTIARALGLNEDLSEAAALSHDLGHTPFGHAGERKLDELLRDDGGFNHNAHGLRVVDTLEKRYADFDGLNLTFEVREAFVRHGGAAVATKFPEFSPDESPLLEVAATLVADDIAYLAHDIDDGLYSGILDEEKLADVELWRQATATADGFRDFTPYLKRSEGVRRIIDVLVTDLVETSKKNIVRSELDSPETVRRKKSPQIVFSPEIEKNKSALKEFLFRNLYRHPNVVTVMEDAREKLARLFGAYAADGEKMPMEFREIADKEGMKRAAADYVAGMTDRFAREEYERIFGS